MKDRHLSLNQTQRVRLEAALHELQSLAPAAASAAAVTVADTIPVNQEDNILKYRASASFSLFLCSVSSCAADGWVGVAQGARDVGPGRGGGGDALRGG
jgi:hypothetical protein